MLSGSETFRRVSPLWPFWPPGFLLDGSRELRVRGGFFSPSLDGGFPLLLLSKPSRAPVLRHGPSTPQYPPLALGSAQSVLPANRHS
jgi:hypothetical protein